MPIGSSAHSRLPAKGCPPARGFTYLGLLFLIALGAAAMGVAAQCISTTAQREKERELLFRGREIAAAIESYRASTAASVPQWPRSFEDLLEDRRYPISAHQRRHHLRRLYSDPFTGQPDWVLITGEDGSLRGVRSRASTLAVITLGLAASAPKAPVRVSDRVFFANAAPSLKAAPQPDGDALAAAEPPGLASPEALDM